jgi:hypothetical protein
MISNLRGGSPYDPYDGLEYEKNMVLFSHIACVIYNYIVMELKGSSSPDCRVQYMWMAERPFT